MAVTNHVFWSGSYSDVPNRPILAKPTPESRCQKRLFAWLLFSLFSPFAVACIGRSLAPAGLHVGLVHASVNHTLIDVLCHVSCVFGACLRGGFYFWLLLFDAWEKGFSRLSPLASPRSLFSPFSLPHTLLVLLAEDRRERCNCRWSLVFNPSSPVIAPFRVLFVSERDGIRLLAWCLRSFCVSVFLFEACNCLDSFFFCAASPPLDAFFFFFLPFVFENAFVSVNNKHTNKQTNKHRQRYTTIRALTSNLLEVRTVVHSCAGKRPGSIGSSGMFGHLIAFCFLFLQGFCC